MPSLGVGARRGNERPEQAEPGPGPVLELERLFYPCGTVLAAELPWELAPVKVRT